MITEHRKITMRKVQLPEIITINFVYFANNRSRKESLILLNVKKLMCYYESHHNEAQMLYNGFWPQQTIFSNTKLLNIITLYRIIIK